MEKHWKNQNNKRNEPDGKTKRNKKTNPDTKDRNNEKPRSTKRHTTLKAHTHTPLYTWRFFTGYLNAHRFY